MVTQKQNSTTYLLKQSFWIYKNNFLTILLVSLFFLLLRHLVNYLSLSFGIKAPSFGSIFKPGFDLVPFLTGTIFNLITSTFLNLIYCVSSILIFLFIETKALTNINEAVFKPLSKMIPQLLILSFLVTLMLDLGIVLIFPGIIFAQLILIEKKYSAIESLKESFKYTKNYWSTLFRVSLFTAVLSIVIYIAVNSLISLTGFSTWFSPISSLLAMIFLEPFLLALTYTLYKNLN